jgi:hypothetical protein
MLISGSPSYLEINLIGRSHPESKDYTDGNWISSEVKTSIPGFTANVSLALRSDELLQFLEEISKVSSGLSNEAALRTMEDALYVKCDLDITGSIKWHCRITYPIGDGSVLNFSFETDNSQIQILKRQLENEMNLYPVVGTPE